MIYLAGADPFFDDRLGRLALTKRGLMMRDQQVLGYVKSLGVPLVVAMAGGYGRQIEDTVDVHFETVKLCSAVGSS